MNNVKATKFDNKADENSNYNRRSLDTNLLHPNIIEEKDAIGLAYQNPNILTPIGSSRRSYSKFSKRSSINSSAAQSSRK